jgi:hypothetical protein
MKTTKTVPGCLAIDLWDVEEDIKAMFKRYGFPDSYDVDKVVTIFRDLTVSRVLGKFCADNNVKWGNADQEALKGLKTELEMIKHLDKLYPNPKEESFKQLIEALRPETPEYWLRNVQPGGKYNTLEAYTKELKEMHSKKFTGRYRTDMPWDMERAIIALQEYLTGVKIDGFKNMPSSFNVDEYITKGVEIINKTITAEFKIKLFKNGRMDIIFFNAPLSGPFMDKFFEFEIAKFKKYLENN